MVSTRGISRSLETKEKKKKKKRREGRTGEVEEDDGRGVNVDELAEVVSDKDLDGSRGVLLRDRLLVVVRGEVTTKEEGGPRGDLIRVEGMLLVERVVQKHQSRLHVVDHQDRRGLVCQSIRREELCVLLLTVLKERKKRKKEREEGQ